MNKQRFHALARTYGGAIARWPLAERGPARWLAFWRRASTHEILRDARRLDRMLQQSATPEFGLALRDSLIDGARRLLVTREERRSWFRVVLVAGLAGTCAAGIAFGFVVAPLTTTDSLTSPMDPAEVAASALGSPTEFGDG